MEMNTENFREGQIIIREGDNASSFYIIKSVDNNFLIIGKS